MLSTGCTATTISTAIDVRVIVVDLNTIGIEVRSDHNQK